MAVFIQVCAFLLCMSIVSAVEMKSGVADSNNTEFFANFIPTLSSLEKSGVLAVGVGPMDPLYYNKFEVDIQDPLSSDSLKLVLFGALFGASTFTVGNVSINYHGNYPTYYIEFTATTGPIELQTYYVLTGQIDGREIPTFRGTFNLTSDSTTRSLKMEVSCSDSGESCYNINQPSWKINDITFSYKFSNVTENIMQVIDKAPYLARDIFAHVLDTEAPFFTAAASTQYINYD